MSRRSGVKTTRNRPIYGVMRDRLYEQRMAAFFSNASAGLCILDVELRYVRINDVLARINGLSPEAHLGRTVREILPEVAPVLEPIVQSVLETGQAIHNLNLSGYVPGDRRYEHHWICSYFPLSDDHGACIGVGCSVVEVTEQKRAEQALRASEALFRQLAGNIQEVFWMTNVESSEVIYISPAFEKIWGRRIQELMLEPRLWLEGIVEEDRERVLEMFGELSRGTVRKVSVEYRVRRPDGVICWVLDTGFPIADERGRIYRVAGVARDITEQKLLEEHQRQTQKMEAIGQLAGGIAHDFNNILGCIMGYAELIEQGATLAGRTREDIRAVLEATRRAQRLVQQILTFSCQDLPRRTPLDLAAPIEATVELLRASLPATIEIEVLRGSELPQVLADHEQVRQIVINLATNAAQAMKMNGQLTISLEAIDVGEERALANPDLHAGRYVVLAVRDTGSGMDEMTISRIFEPFFTTQEPGEGSGLGLSVVHGIMKNYGGAIDVSSRPGEGATFRVYFPAHDAGAKIAPRISGAVFERHERVLLVDDEPKLALLGQRVLEQAGYEVITKTNPFDALATFRAGPAKFDVVVTDLTMPKMTGIDLAGELLKLRPGVPIVLTTGFDDAITASRAQSLGIRELIHKPVSAKVLGAVVRRALASVSEK